jgi:hypothetical protein
MDTKIKKNTEKPEKLNGVFEQKPKSKTTLFWEKYPNGILKIINMKAVLR